MSICKKFYCGIVKIGEVVQSLLLLGIRLFWGYGFFQAGYAKLTNLPGAIESFTKLGIPFAAQNAYLVGGIEMIGGLLLMAGLFSRIAAIPLIIVMLVAYLTAHTEGVRQLFTQPQEFIKQPPFFYFLTSLIIFAFGPGKISLDYLLCRLFRKNESCEDDQK